MDFLVEFEPGHTVGLFGMAALEREPSEIVGRKVDLRTPAELSRYFRDDVPDQAEVQYSNERPTARSIPAVTTHPTAATK